MTALNNLMICLDLTEMDETLIKYTNFLVDIFDPSSVTFIHVMETIELPDELADAFPEMDRPLNELVEEEIRENVKEHFLHADKVKTDVVLDFGLTTEQIVQQARKRKVDLALLGKKIGYVGEGGVAKRIVGLIPASVLMVSETTPHSINSILVRMDFSKISAIALKTARTIASHTEAKLECHHVYKLPLGYVPQKSPSEVKILHRKLSEYVQKEYRAFLKKHKLDDSVPCSYSMDLQGDESQMLYSHAIKSQADLILAGSKIKSQLANVILDTTSEKLADASKSVPIMIIKDQKESIGFLKALFDY